uniref:Uncharacterized protein LOC114324598 n=1 Tax=Diabrotica virgifera virgifera TaxID=50390 RepID=A0A6P7F2Z7_DIAVI
MRIRTNQVFVFFIVFTVSVICVGGFKLFNLGNQNEEVSTSIFNNTLAPVHLPDIEEARKRRRKNRFIFNLILGIFMAKSIILPVVFKAMALMSGISVIMSTFSLVISSLIGYTKLAWKHAGPTIKIIQSNPGSSWSKDDDLIKTFTPGYEQVGDFNELDFGQIHQPLEHVHYYNA